MNAQVIIATAADRLQQGYFNVLQKQVLEAGMTFVAQTLNPFSWTGMIEWEQEIAKRYANDIVCFVDAWDFILQGTKEDVIAALGKDGLLFHSEATCWPEPHKADLYPAVYGTFKAFRYVNGTGPCGIGGAIADAIRYGQENFPIRGRESSMFADCDQRFWTDVFLSGHGRIDNECRLSVALNAVGPQEFVIQDKKLRLYTGTVPAFVHANGASKHRYAKELELLT